MGEVLGADVEALEKVVTRLSNASQTADGVRGSLGNMATDLRFFGRFGDEFTAFVAGQAAPALGRVAEAMASLGAVAHGHARAQQQVSDGEGVSDAVVAGVAAAAGAGTLAAAAQGRGGARPAGAQARGGNQEQHYQVVDNTVRMNDDVRRAVGRMADAYHNDTGQNLTITDGNRTPAEQADRLADRLDGRERLVGFYTNRAAAIELERAYDRAIAVPGTTPGRVRADLEGVIQQQMDRDVYISDHLRAGAVDVRSRDMTDPEAFQRAAGDQGFRVLDERGGRRPHWHLELR